jgi:hypothetical protein
MDSHGAYASGCTASRIRRPPGAGGWTPLTLKYYQKWRQIPVAMTAGAGRGLTGRQKADPAAPWSQSLGLPYTHSVIQVVYIHWATSESLAVGIMI